MTAVQEEVSTFAKIVDRLRLMDEAELKLAYIKLFKNDIEEKWKSLVDGMDFGDVDDQGIADAVYKQRYSAKP